MFKDFDISILSDKPMTKEGLIDELEQFYSKEKQEQYGVLGIRIEIKKINSSITKIKTDLDWDKSVLFFLKQEILIDERENLWYYYNRWYEMLGK